MDLSQTIHRPQLDQGDSSWSNRALGDISSMTVQTVLLHPSRKGLVYWVLNKQETQSIRQNTPKPRGWGNPGGGVELFDRINEQGIPHSLEKTIESCGRRELTDETGFLHFEFKRNARSQLPFIRYDDPYGHCVIILLAQLRDYQSIPIKEVEEIVCGSWFDLSVSPVELFQDKTDLPYWSHVRRTIIILDYVAQHAGSNDLLRTIHPLWNLVFPFVTQDSRFPQEGYLIHWTDWYRIMRVFITRRIHTLDLDCIYEQLTRPHIEERYKERSDHLLVKKKTGSLTSPNSHPPYAQQPSLRSSNFYTLEREKMIAAYEEDYLRWAENTKNAT